MRANRVRRHERKGRSQFPMGANDVEMFEFLLLVNSKKIIVTRAFNKRINVLKHKNSWNRLLKVVSVGESALNIKIYV